jgi:imidazole glycerol phosphate synthase subunit HisF
MVVRSEQTKVAQMAERKAAQSVVLTVDEKVEHLVAHSAAWKVVRLAGLMAVVTAVHWAVLLAAWTVAQMVAL